MTDLEIKISVGLTAGQIKLANSAIDNVEAEALASELHAIIAAYRQLFSVRPPGDLGEHASEEANMVLTLWHAAMGMWLGLLVVCAEKAERFPSDAETWTSCAEALSRAIDDIGWIGA
jgi:hypothetical protein